jgi:hypothetical protein
MPTKEELKHQLAHFQGEILGLQRATTSDSRIQPSLRDILQAANALERQLETPGFWDFDAVQENLRGLRSGVELIEAPRAPRSIVDLGASFFGGAALALVLVVSLFAVGYMVIWMGAPVWQTMSGGRAVLLVALTLSFVTFGGALLVAPLYSEEKLEERFRRSREIFLLFAGMFSTVVGFYFASVDEKATIVTTESFDAAKGELQLTVIGGKSPYVVEIEAGEKEWLKKYSQSIDRGETASFTLEKSGWPRPIKIKVKDSVGVTIERQLTPSIEELTRANFTKPPGTPNTTPQPSVPPADSSKPGGADTAGKK